MALSVAVFRNLDFRRLLAARTLGMFGLQAQAVIVGWQVYTLTNSVFMLGMIGLIEAVPAIICSLFSGHVVDISRPHRIYVITIASLASLSASLLIVAGGLIETSPNFTLYFLFACVFLSGVARSFIAPASFTLQARIVDKKDVAAGSAWMSGGFQCAAIGGPAIAGLIYGGYGAQVAWMIPASALTLALIMALSMSKPHRHHKNSNTREPAAQSIKAGWSFILKHPLLLSVMTLDMFAVLFGGAVAILPAFADQVLHIGSEGLGLLRASPAIGSILTALTMALNPMKQVRARTLLWVVTGFGGCMIGFGLSTSFWSASFFLALSGVFDSVSMVIRGTLMQLLIPDTMRGRVSAVNSMFIVSSNEIGAFESGVAAAFFGLVPSILFGGAMTLLIVTGTALISPQLRRMVISTEEKPA
jgi:MFS family permease